MTEKEYLYVSTVAECANITKAADRLFIAQPSLTQSLHRIEADYGARFFYRNHDGVRLTAAGEAYLAAAEEMIAMYEELKRELGGETFFRGGKISIGLEGFEAGNVLGAFLPRYHKRYPDVDLHITECPAPQLQQMVQDGRLDLALVHDLFVGEHLSYVPVADDELVLAVAEQNPDYVRLASGREKIPYADGALMRRQKFLMPTSNQQIRAAAEHVCAAAGIEPEIRYTAMSMSTVMALAAKGLGVAVVPAATCRQYQALYPLKWFRFPPAWNAAWRLVAAFRGDKVLDEPCRDLVEVLRESLGGVG